MAKIPDWKEERVCELGRRQNVTTKQIGERMGMDPGFIARILRRNGIEPMKENRFNYGEWLRMQYAKDAAMGKTTGRKFHINSRQKSSSP